MLNKTTENEDVKSEQIVLQLQNEHVEYCKSINQHTKRSKGRRSCALASSFGA